MAQKLLTVVGGTGTQGLSVIDAVLNGTDGAYQVRAITRNPTSSKAQALRERGVEVVQADVNDGESLFKAFEVRNTTWNSCMQMIRVAWLTSDIRAHQQYSE